MAAFFADVSVSCLFWVLYCCDVFLFDFVFFFVAALFLLCFWFRLVMGYVFFR